mmetsp:Transcript_31720/g.34068  ORF Transcript_31720/g.34068 Transcript_31720/m.34068 type:complete len:289 (+) Transcript_31720:79-945(+)
MIYFRNNILVLVLASLSLASWGGTTTTVTSQEITDVPVATDAPMSAADAGGADTGDMPILSGVDTPTEAPVVGGVDTTTSAMPSGNTPTGAEATTTTPPVAVVGADYCTYSPDPTCYSNSGKPDCCLDDAVECPAEAAPCDVVGGSETEAPTGGAATTTTPPVAVVDEAASAPPTPQSTDTSIIIPSPGPTTPVPSAQGDDVFEPPAAVVGTDYCSFAPEPTCYPNSKGKPECCLDDAIECVAGKPPCDINYGMDMEKDQSKAATATTRTRTGTTMVLLLFSIIVDQL